MFAYIPARGGSKRVPRKNVLSINGKPMVLHVIDHLLQVDSLSGIGISTDDDEIIQLVSNYSEKVKVLDRRSAELAKDSSTFMDLVRNDVERFAAFFNDRDIMFTLPTSILVMAEHFKDGVQAFESCRNGLVMSVVENESSPFLSLVQSEDGITPLFPEKFTSPTKDLLKVYSDCGCFYAFNLDLMKSLEKFVDLRPIKPIVLSRNIGIDVDNFKDVERLKYILGKKNE